MEPALTSTPTRNLHKLVSTAGAGVRKRKHAVSVSADAWLGHRRMRKISGSDLDDMQWAKKSQPLKTRKSVHGSG